MLNKDIRIQMGNEGFVLRVAALIIHDGRLLLVKNKDYSPYYTVGGGIEIGETTAEAAIREAYEETGHVFEVDRLVYVQERFFSYNEIHNHEVTFYYLMNYSQIDICEGSHTDHLEETLHWIPLEELVDTNVVPAFLKTAFQIIPKTIQHIISVEE